MSYTQLFCSSFSELQITLWFRALVGAQAPVGKESPAAGIWLGPWMLPKIVYIRVLHVVVQLFLYSLVAEFLPELCSVF